MFDKSVALRRLWLQDNPDKDKIIALQKEVRTLRDQIQDKDYYTATGNTQSLNPNSRRN